MIPIAILVFVADQVGKLLAIRALATPRTVISTSRVGLRLLHNARPGLGLLQWRRALVLVWALAAAGTFVAAETLFPRDPIARAGLAAALGGATGNALDLVRRGAVVDFVELRAWPVFNLADIAICAGVAVAVMRAAVALG